MDDGLLPQPGQHFEIARVQGNLSGEFAGLPDGQVFTSDDGCEFRIHYVNSGSVSRIVSTALEETILLRDVNVDDVVDRLDVVPFVNTVAAGTFIPKQTLTKMNLSTCWMLDRSSLCYPTGEPLLVRASVFIHQYEFQFQGDAVPPHLFL